MSRLSMYRMFDYYFSHCTPPFNEYIINYIVAYLNVSHFPTKKAIKSLFLAFKGNSTRVFAGFLGLTAIIKGLTLRVSITRFFSSSHTARNGKNTNHDVIATREAREKEKSKLLVREVLNINPSPLEKKPVLVTEIVLERPR